MEFSVPPPALMIMLFLFVKVKSYILKVRRVEENEYKDNHRRDVERQNDYNLLRKI